MPEQIGISPGGTAGGQQHIDLINAGGQGLRQDGWIVGQPAQVDGLESPAACERQQRGTVAVMDLAGGQWLPALDQFVAGGENAHFQRAENGQIDDALRGSHTQVHGREDPTGREGGLACADVLTPAAHILAGFLAGREGDRFLRVGACVRLGACVVRGGVIGAALDVLLHHHGVGAGRHGGAGHDAPGLPGGQCGRGIAGQRAACHRQRGVTLGVQVGMTQGVAVHGRVVTGGQIQAGNDVTGQHAAEGFRLNQHRPRLDTRCHPVRQQLAGLGHRYGVRVEVRQAGQQGSEGGPVGRGAHERVSGEMGVPAGRGSGWGSG